MNNSPIKVLAVDDSPDLCLLVKEILEVIGNFYVDTVFSVKEAMEALEQHHYDAIVSDYQMPTEDGIQFLKKIRAAGNDIPFILFTGKGREEIVIEAIDGGADAYVQKGTETRSVFAELAHKVRHAVERARANDALKESENRHRSLIDGSSVGMVLTDIDGNFQYSNRRWRDMAGMTDEQSLGKGWMTPIHPDDRASFEASWNRSVETGGEYSFEYRCVRPDKSILWVWGNAAPLRDNSGAITSYLNTTVDITERKKAEEALMEKERAISQASKLANIGYWIWKAETGAVTSSDGLSRLLGIEPGTTLSNDVFFDMVHPDDRKQVINTLEAVLKGMREFNLEHRMVRSDGVVITVRDTIDVTLTKGNRPVFILGVVQDITELAKVSETLQDEKNLYRIIFESLAEGVVVQDKDGNILASNDEAARIMGISSREKIETMNTKDWDVVYEDGSTCPNDDIPSSYTMRTGLPLSNEVRGVPRGQGDTLWMSINTRPIYSTVGERPYAVVVSFTDITGRKKMESELKESEDKYRGLFSHMTDGFFMGKAVYDDHGEPVDLIIVEANKAYAVHTGLNPDVILNKRITEALPGVVNDIPRWINIMGHVAKTGEAISLEDYSKDGDRWFYLSVYSPKKDYFAANFRDITDRKTAHEKLESGKLKMAAGMDLAHLAYWEYDIKSDLFYFDDRFYALYGTTAAKEGGNNMPPHRYVSEFIPPDEVDKVTKWIAFVLGPENTDDHPRTEHRIRRRDGEIRYISVSLMIIRDVTGKPVKTYGVNQDITERKRTEASLKLANEKLNLLSSITRHDIINEMTILKGYMTLVEKDPSGPGFEEYMKKAKKSMDRINARLEFARSYEEIGVKTPGWHDIQAIVKAASRETQLSGVKVVNTIAPGTLVYADPLIYKVISNLIDNAVRHGGSVSTIRFFLEERDGKQAIVCEDDGAGIPAEMKTKLFTRGFGKNHGLGLFLSREILAITGITITEEGMPGRGARFVMTPPPGEVRGPVDSKENGKTPSSGLI